MAKFTVTIKEIHTGEIDVEAANEEEARAKVSDMLEEGNPLATNGEWPTEYSHTLDPDEWEVSKA